MAEMLTPRDRMIKALAFEEADLVPYHLMIEESVRLQLAVYLDDANFEQRLINHLPFYNLEPKITWNSSATYTDAFGAVWRKGSAPHLEHCPLPTATLAGYHFPDLLEPDYFRGAGDFLSRHRQYFTFCAINHGFFDRGWALRGMENFLVDFIHAPRFVEELFAILTDAYARLIDHIAACGFDGIRFGDDWGYQRGVLIGAERWRKFVKPGLKQLFIRARALGLTVMVHSDGDITELIPDLLEMGVQILNPVQPEAMDILTIKREFGRELCLNGGISTQRTLPAGTAEDVRREVAACLRYLGKNGGYVLSPAKAILPDVPMANAAALIEAMVNQPPQGGRRGEEALPERVEALWRVYAEFHPEKGALAT